MHSNVSRKMRLCSHFSFLPINFEAPLKYIPQKHHNIQHIYTRTYCIYFPFFKFVQTLKHCKIIVDCFSASSARGFPRFGYVDQLSRCLNVEYKHLGIDVQCQVPLYVATKMVSLVALVHKPSLFIPTADDYVKAAIRQIGYESRCTPYWAHSLQWFFASLAPDSFLDAWRLSIGIQRRGLVA